jgi:hypothetical protein
MPDVAKASCARSRPIPIRDQCQLEVGWARLDRAMRLASTTSLDSSTTSLDSRGRMRGVGATCTAPTTHGRPKRMTAPECCKIGAGRTQRRRLSVSTASLASQRPTARGFAGRSTGLAGCVQYYASVSEICATRRVFRGPGDRQAPIFRSESEGGIRRRVRRQPGGESGRDWCMDVVTPVRAAGMPGVRLGGSHHGLGNGGCCKVGEPAGYRLTQPRATISMSRTTGLCGRPSAEAAERRLGPHWNAEVRRLLAVFFWATHRHISNVYKLNVRSATG